MQPWLDLISPRLNTLWRGEWPAHFVEPARYLYDHELVLVMKGRFSLQIENSRLEMDAGSFAVIPPQTNHVSVAARGKVFRSCLHFDWLGGPERRRPICSYFPKFGRRHRLRPHRTRSQFETEHAFSTSIWRRYISEPAMSRRRRSTKRKSDYPLFGTPFHKLVLQLETLLAVRPTELGNSGHNGAIRKSWKRMRNGEKILIPTVQTVYASFKPLMKIRQESEPEINIPSWEELAEAY